MTAVELVDMLLGYLPELEPVEGRLASASAASAEVDVVVENTRFTIRVDEDLS